MQTILVIDDEKYISLLISKIFRDSYHVLIAENGEEALKIVETQTVDIVLLDQNLPGMDGLEILKRFRQLNDRIPVIMITGHGTISLSVKAMKLGASDYITKPFDPDEMSIVVAKALQVKELEDEVKQLHSELNEKYSFHNIIGKSRQMQEIFQLISSVACTDISVLITGESGTGKELVAKALHFNGNNKNAPFVAINCAAIPEQLLESELFGYEKGAFSGAINNKKGKVELADKGTLFLDEIGDMTEKTQAKLLRFLQNGQFERVGGTEHIQVNARIIAATNKDIECMLEEGSFRKDLYYRINGMTIELPSLVKRKEDVPLLIDHFIKKFNPDYDDRIKGINSDAMRLLLSYDWPGNIRELENTIQSAMALTKGKLVTTIALPNRIKNFQKAEPLVEPNIVNGNRSLNSAVEDLEKAKIAYALKSANNNRTETARLLNMSLRNLHYKIKKYEIGKDA
ncbi:MAG: sigma-54-dependent transcriptional regulator [Candidatus Anammoxibacter sp.]